MVFSPFFVMSRQLTERVSGIGGGWDGRWQKIQLGHVPLDQPDAYYIGTHTMTRAILVCYRGAVGATLRMSALHW